MLNKKAAKEAGLAIEHAPAFDKTEYRNRRQARMRGQPGVYLRGTGAMQLDRMGRPIDAKLSGKPITKKARLKNTKRARKEQNYATSN